MDIPAQPLPKIGGITSSKSFTLVAPIGGIIVSLVVLAFVVWPKYGQIKELRVANADLETRAKSLEEKVKVLEGLDSAALEKQLAASEALLPSNKDVFVLIRQVENASSTTGIILDRVEVVPGTINDSAAPQANLQAPPAGSPLIPSSAAKVEMRLSITSSYGSLLGFLSKMYSGARTINISDIGIASASGGQSQVRASLTLGAFWEAPPSDLGAIEKPVAKLTQGEEELLNKVGEQGVSSVPTVPQVPLGRTDLFAPY